MSQGSLLVLLLITIGVSAALAQSSAPPKAAPNPGKPAGNEKKVESLPIVPTAAEVAYGLHPKQVLDFWKADSPEPTPLIVHVHGGGWMGGDRKSSLAPVVTDALKAGISVVSVEYRFVSEAMAEGVVPPVKGPMTDVARAVQFVRSKASEWNLDKNRIGGSGRAAGGCTVLWLAFHDDMADPKSADPVSRESTRLHCAAVTAAQTTLDPKQMREWTPNSRYGAHAWGIVAEPGGGQSAFDLFLEAREKLLPWIKEYSPYELVSAGDPPVGLYFENAPAPGEPAKDPTHTANFGVKLKERCDALKVPCDVIFPGAQNVQHPTPIDFLKAKLKPGALPAQKE